MLCGKMITVAFRTVPCGQCLHCRINYRRMRTARLLLEAKAAAGPSSFVTVTYDDSHLPWIPGYFQGTLDREEAKLWMRKVKRREPTVRYALVGEYGLKGQRPHYHAAFFGVSPGKAMELLLETWTDKTGALKGDSALQTATILEPTRAAYLAGYTVKKLTNPNDGRLLPGQEPEFYRQSLRPAIGVSPQVIKNLAELHYGKGGSQLIKDTWNVASSIRIGGKVWPLDRTIRKHLRRELGLPETESGRWNPLDDITEEERNVASQLLSKNERREAKRTPGEHNL